VLWDILNAVPISLLAAVVLALGVVVLAVWLIRRMVPDTREGFHGEISAPMLLGRRGAVRPPSRVRHHHRV
jgi:membrane protein implicated in regulation of membrane protease activity